MPAEVFGTACDCGRELSAAREVGSRLKISPFGPYQPKLPVTAAPLLVRFREKANWAEALSIAVSKTTTTAPLGKNSAAPPVGFTARISGWLAVVNRQVSELREGLPARSVPQCLPWRCSWSRWQEASWVGRSGRSARTNRSCQRPGPRCSFASARRQPGPKPCSPAGRTRRQLGWCGRPRSHRRWGLRRGSREAHRRRWYCRSHLGIREKSVAVAGSGRGDIHCVARWAAVDKLNCEGSDSHDGPIRIHLQAVRAAGYDSRSVLSYYKAHMSAGILSRRAAVHVYCGRCKRRFHRRQKEHRRMPSRCSGRRLASECLAPAS